jgi:hypothetical protein
MVPVLAIDGVTLVDSIGILLVHRPFSYTLDKNTAWFSCILARFEALCPDHH